MNYLLLDIDRFPNEAVTKTETTDVFAVNCPFV
jgi:hypothetical protein